MCAWAGEDGSAVSQKHRSVVPALGPKQVLRYLARYTHRVAISNRRLVSLNDRGVTFKWKDYRVEGPQRYKVMTLDTHEFIHRFLMHVLPQGFHTSATTVGSRAKRAPLPIAGEPARFPVGVKACL